MMGCKTDGCIAVETFVKSLMAKRSDVPWSVFEEQSDLNVYVRLWLPGNPKTLSLEKGQVQKLDDLTKQKITRWGKPQSCQKRLRSRTLIVAGSTPATTRFAKFCNRRAEPNAIEAVSSRAFLSWSGLRRLSTERRSTTLRTWTFLKCSSTCARSVNMSTRQSWCWSALRENTANGVGVHPRG